MRTGELALAIMMTAGASAATDPSTEVHIYVRGAQHVDLLVTLGAQRQASEMFRSAGIQIVWKFGQPDQETCCKPEVVLEYGTDANRAPGVMGYAFPNGNGSGGIKILYRRIVAKRRRPEKVLAHVIVHEVSHMLQGVARHSDSGIMKAWWSREDYEQIERAPLAFTAVDIQLIQAGVAKRIAKAAADKALSYNGPVPQVTIP
jgi:hypothetical protein